MEAGVWGGGGVIFCTHHVSLCYHGNSKHSALVAYSLWNPMVSVHPQLIFPIERADIWLCLFAHEKFADVSVERTDEGQRQSKRTER